MGSRLSAPGPQEKRFAAYIEGLANAAGHEDRHAPLKNYCKGLLLPGERKSIEPMAARLDPENVQPMRQSLHHLVAKAPWSDEMLLGAGAQPSVTCDAGSKGQWWPGSWMTPGFRRRASIRSESRVNIADK